MQSALVTGASRGLGRGLALQLAAASPATRVLAACRRPQDLQDMCEKYPNLHVIKLDVTDVDSFDTFAQEVSELTKDSGLNLLINNAGAATKFTTLNYVKSQQIVDNFMVNTVGPIMLTKALLPILKRASEKNSTAPMGINRAAIINMSSLMGSIAKNEQGGFYPYRCSKAALNAATKSMSIDLKKDGIMAVSMHPGWVKTDMGGQNAPLDIDTSITEMLKTFAGFGEDNSGRFYQYDGVELEW